MIPEEDKVELRAAIPALLDNESLEIDIQLSTVLATVAKHDFPLMYPDLLQSLLTAATESENRTPYLTSLHFVVKMIATLHDTKEYSEFEGDRELREAYDMKMSHLREASPSIVISVVTAWAEMSAKLVTQIAAYLESGCQNPHLIDGRLCYDAYYGFRILHTLLVCHLPTLHAANPQFFMTFCTMLASRIEAFAVLVRTASVVVTENGLPLTYPGSVHLNKLYNKMIKFVVNIQIEHPITFTPVLLSFLNYFIKEFCDWKDEWRGIHILETPLIHYMAFISHVLSTKEYLLSYLETAYIGKVHANPDYETVSEEGVRGAHGIVSTYFSQTTLISLLQAVVGRFFKFQADRLEIWDADPEQFWEEDLADATFTIRNAAENLFFRLQQYDSDLICNESLRMLQQVRLNCQNAPENVSLEDILLKDACMSLLSLGYISFSSGELIDWDQIQPMLEEDIQNPDPRYRCIRRTAARVIGAWVEDIYSDAHKPAWEILLALLVEEEDVIVKLTSTMSINNLLGSMDLDYEPYSSCIKPNVERLLSFLRQSANTPFARIVLKQLSEFISNLSDRIAPYTTAVVDHITEFWDIADQNGQSDLKQPIVGILASFCESLPDYRAIYGSLIHVARQTTDLDHPDSVLLLEAGMRLWWNLVQTADTVNEDLLELFPRVGLIYARVPHDPNMISLTIRLLESYFILGGAQIVQTDVEGVAATLELLVTTSSREIMTAVLDLLITFFQLFPNDAPAVIRPALAKVYHALFVRYPKHSRIVKRSCTLFMQILLKNAAFFFELLADPFLNAKNPSAGANATIDPEAPMPLQRVVSRFLDVWEMLELIEPEKVWTCGFSALFASGNEGLNTFAPRLVDAIAALILTLRKHTKDTATRKQYTEHSDVLTIKNSTVDVLRHRLKSEDISKATVTVVEEFAISNISSTLQAMGAEWEQELAGHIDPQTSNFLAAHLPR